MTITIPPRIRTIARAGWLRLLVLFLTTDVAARMAAIPGTFFDARVYLLSASASLLFFMFIDRVHLLLPVRVRPWGRWLMSLPLAFIWIASILVYSQFGDYVTTSKLKFVLNNPEYFKAFTRGYLLNWNFAGFLAVWGAIAWWWRTPAAATASRPTLRSGGATLLAGVLYLVLLNQLVFAYKGKTVTIDTSFALALKQMRAGTSMGLYRSARLMPESEPAPTRLNVLLVINESFGREAFDGSEEGRPAMPRLHARIARDPMHMVSFGQAFTSAGATDVSVPSLLTGVAPYEPSRKLHTMPFLWDWANAAGMHTLFVSAQMLGWGNLKEFFLSPGPRTYLTGEMTGLPYVNDTGVDELAAMDRFIAELDSIPSGVPFAAIYGSNALHAPFQQTSSQLAAAPGFRSPYLNAAAILDLALDRMLSALERKDLLRSTVVIITSDHGETAFPRNRATNRLYSFYDEIARIPFLIRIPEQIEAATPAACDQLRANRHATVSNLDILPTVLDFIGAGSRPQGRQLRSALSGHSLLRPVAPDRAVIMLNTNDIRQWEYEGFGIYWKDRRFVFSNLEGPRFFTVQSDSLEQYDHWKAAPTEDRDFVRSIIDTTFHLKRMYSFPHEAP